jgi:hypothetical protein
MAAQMGRQIEGAQSESARLANENALLRKAYWKMRNAAAGYSNFCDDSASVRRCERDYEEAESLFRSITT